MKSTYRFIDNLPLYDFVGVVEVIGRDTSNVKGMAYNYTIVKVLRQLTTAYYGQEFRIVESKGHECITGLRHRELGNRIIIKGTFSPKSEWDFDCETYLNPPKNEEQVLSLSLCDTHELFIGPNTDNVSGYLYNNKLATQMRRDRIINKLSFGRIKTKRMNKHLYITELPLISYRNAIRIIEDELHPM